MADGKPRVFLSHKGTTKGRIKPIALALLRDGFALFIDKPSDMGFSPADCEDLDIKWIEGLFRDVIKAELDGCQAVLGCLCKDIDQQAKVWQSELLIANQTSKLVLCRIDDVEVEHLPELGTTRLSDPQSWRIETEDRDPREYCPDAAIEQVRSQLEYKFAVKELKRLCGIAQPSAEADKDLGVQARPLPNELEIENVLPLAGRCDAGGPYQSFEEVLLEARKSGGIRPAIVCGPELELVEAFINEIGSYFWFERKLETTLIQRFAGRRGVTNLRPEGTRENLIQSLEDTLRGHLGAEFDPGGAGDISAIADGMARLAQPPGPLVCVSHPYVIVPSRRGGDNVAEIDAWIETWEEIAMQPGLPAIVPVLPVILHGADPEWADTARLKDCPYPPIPHLFKFVSGPCRNTRFYKTYFAEDIAFRSGASSISVAKIGVIPPIDANAATTWARNHGDRIAPALIAEVDKHVRNVGKPRMTMTSFSEFVLSVVTASRPPPSVTG